MSELPTLIVDGPPSEWLPGTYDEPLLTVVRIDGDLPTVYPSEDIGRTHPRPLRVGDRVTLATIDRVSYSPGGYEVPFATATVNKIEGNLVTVANVKALT